MEFKFDHTQDNMVDACGITEEFVEELFDKMNEKAKKCTSTSEVVEIMANSFSKEELAYTIALLQKQISAKEDPMSLLKEMLSYSEDETTESTSLSKGGDA